MDILSGKKSKENQHADKKHGEGYAENRSKSRKTEAGFGYLVN